MSCEPARNVCSRGRVVFKRVLDTVRRLYVRVISQWQFSMSENLTLNATSESDANGYLLLSLVSVAWMEECGETLYDYN